MVVKLATLEQCVPLFQQILTKSKILEEAKSGRFYSVC